LSSTSKALDQSAPLAPNFSFWQSPAERTVAVGADAEPFPLPVLPLPLYNDALIDGEPSDTAIGNSLYDYLRQFPDCPHNDVYASLLRDAWPHYLADLASQAIMLNHKVVDAPYVQRKIVSLKILLLLSPDNPGLLLQIGLAYNDLGMMFSELHCCRRHLLAAMDNYLRVQRLQPFEPSSLNGLAQIDYLLGDYPSARKRWQALLPLLSDTAARDAVAGRLDQLSGGSLPDYPLLDDLESIGEAMQLLANDGAQDARQILERLVHDQRLLAEFPSPEFYCLLAASRERTGDNDGACVAFTQALDLEPGFVPATAGMDRLQSGGQS